MKDTKQITIWAAAVATLVIPITANAALYTNTIFADNPKLYYRLNESSGTTAFDSATGDGAQNATHAGSITLNQTGALTGDNPSDTAALFAGGSGWLDSTYVLNPTLAFTVEFWLKPTSLAGPLDQTVLAQRNGTGLGRSLVYWNGAGQKMSTFLGGSEHSWVTSPLVVGQYTHVAFEADRLLMADRCFRWWGNGAYDYNHGLNGPSFNWPTLGEPNLTGPPALSGMNELFADGHVEWKPRSAFKPDAMEAVGAGASDPTIGYVRGGGTDATYY